MTKEERKKHAREWGVILIAFPFVVTFLFSLIVIIQTFGILATVGILTILGCIFGGAALIALNDD